MDILGLLAELLFLAGGVYLYLFSIGKIKASQDPAVQAKADEFRLQNNWWLRLLSLALIAIMSVNVFLHVSQMMGGGG